MGINKKEEGIDIEDGKGGNGNDGKGVLNFGF